MKHLSLLQFLLTEAMYTIYVMKLNDVEMLYDDICIFLRKYACGYKLKYSTHVVGPIWKRIDRDKDGNYIPANPNERKNIKNAKTSIKLV